MAAYTRRPRSSWDADYTLCGEMLTHRCTRCPWWCCADEECTGAAWSDSDGAVNAWNQEAGLTRSWPLDPVQSARSEWMGYGSVYNNTAEPWGITDGGNEQDGYWRAYKGYGTLFDASQHQSGGSRGMMQWRNGWGGQQSRSSANARCDPRS